MFLKSARRGAESSQTPHRTQEKFTKSAPLSRKSSRTSHRTEAGVRIWCGLWELLPHHVVSFSFCLVCVGSVISRKGEAKAVEEMPEDEYRPLRIGCRCARMDVRTGDMGKVRTSGRFHAPWFPVTEARGRSVPEVRTRLPTRVHIILCLFVEG